MISKRTLYDILGVEPDAPIEKIRAVYRLRSKETYPRSPGVGDEELQKQINGAYDILQDPEKRQEYNRQLGLPKPRSLKPGQPIYEEISVSLETKANQIPVSLSRWEPCNRCWGEGCTGCQGQGKRLETISLTVTISPGVSQVVVEGQGAITEPGGSRGDLILYVVWS